MAHLSQSIMELLRGVSEGRTTPEKAFEELRHLPYQELGYAKIDWHRTLRKGFPEVVFCLGKTPDQVASIMSVMSSREGVVMATRATPEMFRKVKAACPEATYFEQARIIAAGARVAAGAGAGAGSAGSVVVACAGTADLPVAEEAAVTGEILGDRVSRLYDVGVAGLHRLLDGIEQLEAADAVICVAGMEGALPSVVAGLVPCPVVAVPTSVGYGSHLSGLAPLLAMLNSCAPGLAVVNVDNGFGAACFAHLVASRAAGKAAAAGDTPRAGSEAST